MHRASDARQPDSPLAYQDCARVWCERPGEWPETFCGILRRWNTEKHIERKLEIKGKFPTTCPLKSWPSQRKALGQALLVTEPVCQVSHRPPRQLASFPSRETLKMQILCSCPFYRRQN